MSVRAATEGTTTKCPAFQPGIPEHDIEVPYLPRIVTGT
jgi:hypothetical protein